MILEVGDFVKLKNDGLIYKVISVVFDNDTFNQIQNKTYIIHDFCYTYEIMPLNFDNISFDTKKISINQASKVGKDVDCMYPIIY
jgi:hypothetical protein